MPGTQKSKISKAQAFFFSDLHLREEHFEDIEKLKDFVDQLIEVRSQASLYFLGDVFDFWFGEVSPVKSSCVELFKTLRTYNEQCGSVIFFEGNHDIHLSPFFDCQWGFEVVSHQKVILLGQKSALLDHGDLFNPEDQRYLALRSILRHPMIRFLALYILPHPIILCIGRYLSRLSLKHSKINLIKEDQGLREKFLNYARKELENHKAQIFIGGHIHQRFYKTFKNQASSPHSLEIINLGSWFQSRTVLSFDGLGFEFLEL